jgi:pimeloyl-ACP methyl ester carboxylesterase
MTQAFLDVKVYKMFMVSRKDQMCKTLIRTHMEGKFKLATIYQTGHHMHEDQPKDFARLVKDYLKAFNI